MHPVDHVGGFVEITDGVGFTPSFANVSAFDTGDGLVLVDTGSLPLASVVHADIRRWSSAPLHTAVYSHGHIDHVFGVPVWEQEAKEQGWEAPEVIAHHALPARFDRYIFTAGYNTIINRRQFGFKDLNWPTTYRYPDRTYHEVLDLSVGGTDFPLRHEKGETDDHTVTWQADSRVLCCGDLFIWASPNAGNPQKVQRYPREWAQALRRMLTLEAEFLLPGHGLPVVGADRVRQALTDTADLLDSLVDQTLAVMNAGGRLDDAIHSVRAPGRARGAPVSAPGLRRARVHRPHGLAPVRRVVGRQPGHAQAGAASGPWPPSSPPWPGGRASWPSGRSSCWPAPPSGADGDAEGRRRAGRHASAWPAIWPRAPGWPAPPTARCSGPGNRCSPPGPHGPRRPWPAASSTGPPTSRCHESEAETPDRPHAPLSPMRAVRTTRCAATSSFSAGFDSVTAVDSSLTSPSADSTRPRPPKSPPRGAVPAGWPRPPWSVARSSWRAARSPTSASTPAPPRRGAPSTTCGSSSSSPGWWSAASSSC